MSRPNPMRADQLSGRSLHVDGDWQGRSAARGDAIGRYEAARKRQPLRSVAMTHPDAELDPIVASLEGADLVEQYVNEDGKDALRLTDRGRQLGRAIAMAGDDSDPEAVLAALMDEQR